FFSSRRRHTRWPRDWSSDVCSSDLQRPGRTGGPLLTLCMELYGHRGHLVVGRRLAARHLEISPVMVAIERGRAHHATAWSPEGRSEERRVGKELRWRRCRVQVKRLN